MSTYAPVLLHPYSFPCNNDADKRVEVGWNLWRSAGPPPLHEQGHLQLVAQDKSRCLLYNSKGGDSITPLDDLS